MSKITATGFECDVMVLEITKTQFSQLAKSGRNCKAWENLHDDLMNQALLYGFTFDVQSINFEVHVGGKNRTGLAVTALSQIPAASIVRQSVSSPKGHYLVRDTWTTDARWSLETKERFNPKKLEFQVDEIAIPDGSYRSLVGISYDGVEMERNPECNFRDDVYLVGPDGARIVLSTESPIAG